MIVWLMYSCFTFGGLYLFLNGLIQREIFPVIIGALLVFAMYNIFLEGQKK